jgi:predicted nucleic acid-binding Zn ribbon protein
MGKKTDSDPERECWECGKPTQVGVYCAKCMARIRADKKRRRQAKAYWVAVENGAGDLWRV